MHRVFMYTALIAGSLHAQSGRVLDQNKLPVSSATITVQNGVLGIVESTKSASDGTFSFADLHIGSYLLTVEAANLASYSRSFEVSQTQPVSLGDIKLHVAGLGSQVTVVSGSRIEELRDESAVKVDVLTRKDILSTGYERVSDVLSELPGVVTRRTSTATVGGEQIQGIDSRQVLVLQDGLPIVGARGIKSGALNLNRQDIGKIDSIEVVKGAASSLYGSDAIGGVINMITREPTEPLQVGATLSGGSLGAIGGRVNLGSKWKNLSWFTDLESHRQDAYGLLPNDPTTVGPDFKRNDLLAKIRYAFTPRIALGFTATAYHSHELGKNATTSGLTLGTSNDSMQTYALTGDFLLTNTTTLQARAYSARYDENSDIALIGVTAPVFGFANLNERYHRIDSTISQQFGPANVLQGGVEWTQDLYRGANRLVGDNAGQQVTTNDVWLQDRAQWKRLTVTLGGRIQHHSLFGTWAVPKVGLVYKLSDNWVIRGSFGKGFRAPDLGQLYFRFANPASFYQVIGNPTLRPETSASYSTGIQYRSSRFRAGLSLYRNNLRNLIDTYTAGTPQTSGQLTSLLNTYGIPANFTPLLNRLTFVYLNFGRVYTQGFELDGEVALTRHIRAQGSYTYLNAVDDATHLALAQRHRHQAFFKTEYNNPRYGFLADIRGSFYSRWLLNPAAGTFGYGYQIWDLYGSKDLIAGLQAYGAIENLADSRDRKLDIVPRTFDRPDYGRTFRIGMRYNFPNSERTR